MVCGTLIGALMGTLVALDIGGAEMEHGVRSGFLGDRRGSVTGDFNLLPVLSLLNGRRSRDALTRSVQHLAGHDIDVEDCWKSFSVVASNFSHGREEVLTTGRLVRNVAASAAIPGALPPVLVDGSLMLDGGTFNNLPIDVMARQGVGKIIAVDVTGHSLPPLDIAAIPSPLALLLDRFRARHKQRFRGVPTLPETMLMSTFVTSLSRQRQQQRQADLLFQPRLPRVGLLDWQSFDQLVAAGRHHAEAVLDHQVTKVV